MRFFFNYIKPSHSPETWWSASPKHFAGPQFTLPSSFCSFPLKTLCFNKLNCPGWGLHASFWGIVYFPYTSPYSKSPHSSFRCLSVTCSLPALRSFHLEVISLLRIFFLFINAIFSYYTKFGNLFFKKAKEQKERRRQKKMKWSRRKL